MAATNTSIPTGKIAAHTIALSAATVDTVTFADDCEEIEILSHDGTARIFFTVDGSTPTVAGNNTFVIPAAAGASVRVPVPTSAGSVVKLISSGTPTYSVTRTG